jgi:hypothetical protein
MRSFLQQIENKFMLLNESLDSTEREEDNVDSDKQDSDLDEQNVAAALDGGAGPPRTPAAFRKTVKRVNYASGVEESVNKPANWTLGSYQKPEDEEEEYTDKFPFAEHDKKWQHRNFKYPSVDLRDTPGLSKRKDKTQKVKLPTVAETMDAKYEHLIESYRAYATGDAKATPEQKIKHTIKEVARQLQEIERTVNYASRLKTESGVARNGYGSSVESALSKISERLIKISERVRALGE